MLPTFLSLFVAFLAASAPVSGRALITRRGSYMLSRQDPAPSKSLNETAKSFPELSVLVEGNQRFRDSIANSDHPNLFQDQTNDGQAPGFLFIGCSDSRASEGTIFNALPGTLFTERNIANRYVSNDINAVSILSYAVTELGVSHVIVMGHYGCGGVGASILAKPASDALTYAGGAVQNWIEPIRNLYTTSTRSEIVKLRESNPTTEPEFADPGYRALVEENVKQSVSNVVQDPVIQAHWDAFKKEQDGSTPAARRKRAGGEGGPLKPVFVHGLVYDISTGQVTDLSVSAGPPGLPLQTPPAPAVKRHVDSIEQDHQH